MAKHINIEKKLKQASACLDGGKLARAETLCRDVLARRPDHAAAWGLMGRIHQARGAYPEAVKAYRKVLERVPENHETRLHLIHCCWEMRDYDAMTRLAQEIEHDSRPESALSAFRAYCYACDWSRAERLRHHVLDALRSNAVPPSYLPGALLDLNALPGLDAQTVFDIHKLWGDHIIQEARHHRLPLRQTPAPGERIRIGYLSADFNMHPVGNLIRPVLANHDTSRFEIFCYAHLHKQDAMTKEIRAHAEHFVDVTDMKHDEIALRINRDGIHILVDLGGHTTHSQLPVLAFKPAPVQITWLGYPNTTGMATVDYRITDRHADLEENHAFHTERLLFMPESFLTIDSLPDIPRCQESPAVQNGFVTFGSFNNIRKLNPAVVRVWSRILRETPGSRLLIKSPGCESRLVRGNILREFSRNGISEERIEFAPYTRAYHEHAAQYNRVDIALDPFPYHGTHTTLEALWMGVPVITLEGSMHVQRVSSSILRNIGYEVTIATSEDEYVAKAVELASIPENLGIVRQCLATLIRHSAICRPWEFTRNLENLYLTAYETKSPASEHPVPPPSSPREPISEPQALMICDRLEPLTWHALRSHCNAILAGESRAWLTVLVPPVQEQQRILRNLTSFLQLHYGNQADTLHIRLAATNREEHIDQHIARHDILCLPGEASSPVWQTWKKIAQRTNTELLALNADAVRISQSKLMPLPPLSDDTVTIVIPTYNRLSLLKRAVSSALNQQHDSIRLIIGDNASTDGTNEWCEELAQHDTRVRHVRHEHNLGAAENFRRLYDMIDTDLFVFCADDDELTSNHLARTVPMFKQHPGLGMAYGQSHIVDLDGQILNTLDFTNTVDCLVDPRHELLESFLRNQIIWNSALVRKLAVDRLLHGADPNMAALMEQAIEGDDYLFGVLLLASAPAAYVNTVTARFTINPESESATLLDGGLELEIGVLEQLPDLYDRCFGMDDDARRALQAGLEMRRIRLQKTKEQLSTSKTSQYRQWEERIQNLSDRIQALQTKFKHNAHQKSTFDFGEWSQQVKSAVQQFRDLSKQQRGDALERLRALRAVFVQEWLAQPQWNENLFNAAKTGCRELMFSGLRYEPLVNDERILVHALKEELAKSNEPCKLISTLLPAMLYSQPHELPVCHTPDQLPPAFLDLYLDFIHTIPELFFHLGEADRYYRFMKTWTGIIHNQTMSGHLSDAWKHIMEHFTFKSNFIPVYMNDHNLCHLFTQRAEIMATLLASHGNKLDWRPARKRTHKRIRMGILANHFTPQTETFAVLPFFEHLDRHQFEVILIAFHTADDPLEQYCRSQSEKFIHLKGHAVSDWVKQVRELDLDMLILASNVTAVGNATALTGLHRLARIQMASVASCVSTGMESVDYYISGSFTEPEQNAEQDYRETLCMLSGPAHCYHFAAEEEKNGQIIRRSDLGVPDEAILYVSGANYYKITPEVEMIWARILTETPQAFLLLYPFNPNWSNTYATWPFIRRMQATFERHGIPTNRLIIMPPKEYRGDIKAMLSLADVYLDSFPFSGVTSLIDPLECNLPPVVMAGQHFRSRMAEACLRDIEVPELICDTPEQYVEVAVRLGHDEPWRNKLRQRIRSAMIATPSFLDHQTYGKACEQLLLDLADKHGLFPVSGYGATQSSTPDRIASAEQNMNMSSKLH